MKNNKQKLQDLQKQIERSIEDCKKTESKNQPNNFQKADIQRMKNEYNKLAGLKVY